MSRGRVKLLAYLPALNRAIKAGLVSQNEMQKLVKKYQGKDDLTSEDIIFDLLGVDVPEEKFHVLGQIVQESEQGGSNNEFRN